MAKFNAVTAVESLEYDFEPYQPGVTGVIPEPSSEQIETYFEKARTVAKEVMALKSKMEKVQGQGGTDVEEMSEQEIAEIVTDLESIDVHEIQRQMVDLISDLCSQTPTSEQINALPFRVRQEFMKWVGLQFRSK